MALIEDVFRGNLTAGLAISVGAIIFGPTVIQTIGSIFRPAAKTLLKSGMVFYRETLSELGGNGDRSRRRGESRTRSGGWRRPTGATENRSGGGARASRHRLKEPAVIAPRRRLEKAD